VYNAMDTGGHCADADDTEVDHDQQADVLTYWNDAQKQLSILSAVAKFIGITATSVASERVFSSTGYIVSDGRALLKPTKVQELTFLNCNWHL